ncbi:MAG: TrkH family potassium uptake protein [Bacillota bacterium]|nr:TrkH family potassium uptake protein [Bacillota bacterium]MDW7678440.1 TrkH family potassium uptake protein [Bacillota bacterium]
MKRRPIAKILFANPARVLVLGFVAVITLGMLLLLMPAASRNNQSVGLVNALFTATSAVCVTGLVVVDTGTHWTLFGKTVIAILIQVGGIGFMSMATLFAVILGKQITLRERLIIQQAVGQDTLSGVVRFALYMLTLTLVVQSLGVMFLSFRFIPEYGLMTGLGYAVFHSISAFCNAGFDLIGNGRSLTPYVNDPLVSLTIGSLIILGGLGFTVILDALSHYKTFRFTLHTRLVLLITGFLLAVGTAVFLVLEWNNPATLGDLPLFSKLLAGFFQSLTTRTAGFNTIDTAGLTSASQVWAVVLMFIGGSPASTAGGIKTITFGVMIIMTVSVIQGKEEVEIFKRKIPYEIVNRAITIFVIGIILLVTATMLLLILENQFPFIAILFEVTSAFGTVGLSTGITSLLSTPGKLLLIVTMFTGRVGTLTIAFALAKRQNRHLNLIHYPRERIIVG